MYKYVLCLVIPILFCGVMAGESTEKKIIKLGTLATEASDWGQAFQQMNAELIERGDGNLEFQFYFGRDERDLIDLLKSKRLDAVSVSVPGLGQILPQIFAFQLPMLFSTYEELDYVRNGLSEYFGQQFEHRGYVLLGWGDLGFTYLFSKALIKTETDLQKTKLWVWDIDPIAKAFASSSGIEPVLLPVQSVLSSLIEGEIQTAYAPPLACIVYQWHTQVEYMTDLPLAAGVGATILNSGLFDTLSDDQKQLLRAVTEKYHRQLVTQIRQRNEESIAVLQEQGIQIVQVPHQEKLKWLRVAGRVQNQFVGQLYERELLNDIKGLLDEFHSKEQ